MFLGSSCPKGRWRSRIPLALIVLTCLTLVGTTSVAAQAAPARPANGNGITVNLTASPTSLWPTQYSILTATTNINLGPTPYYLKIYDLTAGTYVGSPCGTGTGCAAVVTQPTAGVHCYVAVVGLNSASFPPASEQAQSGSVCVVWQGISVSLSASPTTLPVGDATTLTAIASADVSLTPFYIDIFDVTNGKVQSVRNCTYSSSCSVTISQSSATAEEYVAYVATSSTAYPPTGIQATSLPAFVTWSDLGWNVSLSAPASTYGTAVVTATANQNVGSYDIDIFELSPVSEQLLAKCTNTATCSANVTPAQGSPVSVVAFIVHPYPVLRGTPDFPVSLTLASSRVDTVARAVG